MGIFLFQGEGEIYADFEAKWGIHTSADFEAKWHILSFVYADWMAIYALAPLEIDLLVPYSIRYELEQEYEALYHIMQGEVFIDFEARWGVALSVDFLALYEIPNEVQLDFEAPYHILETSVEIAFASFYDIIQNSQVEADFKALWVIISFISEQIDNVVTGIVAGEDVEFFSVRLSGDDDSYCIALSADMASVEDWTLCVPGEQIDIIVNGTEFALLIDSRKRTRNFERSSYAIEGRSITAKLGKGFASPITKTWEAITAREVIDELCLVDGISYLFELVDWLIPANTLAAESVFPIEIIDKIAKASGGIVQTKPDGTLVIRPKYPVPPPEYDSAIPVLSISDVDDIFTIEESKVVKPKWNAVRVMDEPDSSSKRYNIKQVEYDAVARTSIVAVTSSPFDPDVELKFNHSNILGTVSAQYQGLVEKEIIETVKIVNGKSSVGWIVDSIVSYDYLNNIDLGAIIPGDGAEVKTIVIGQSIVKVTYKTYYHEFRVRDTEDEQVQVYVED